MKKLTLLLFCIITTTLYSFAPADNRSESELQAELVRYQKEARFFSLHEEALNKLKEFEGLSLIAYKDCHGMTIGYGHFIESWEKVPTIITSEMAQALLEIDFEEAMQTVEQNTCLNRFDNPEQVLALAHFTFNFGGERFIKSTLLKKINGGLPIDHEIIKWNKITVVNPITKESEKVVLDHLTMRRNYELNLYKTPNYESC